MNYIYHSVALSYQIVTTVQLHGIFAVNKILKRLNKLMIEL